MAYDLATTVPKAGNRLYAQEIINRLELIKDRLNLVPEDHFDMRDYILVQADGDLTFEEIVEELSSYHNCGTEACVAGYMVTIPFFRELGMRFSQTQGIVYGVTQDDCVIDSGRLTLERLTGLNNWIIDELFFANLGAKPKDKIDEIEQIIAGITLDYSPVLIAHALESRRKSIV